jgi:hypothetical protein
LLPGGLPTVMVVSRLHSSLSLPMIAERPGLRLIGGAD